MADEDQPASNVKQFKLVTPEVNVAESDIPQALRNLADDIDTASEYEFGGKVTKLVWVAFTDEGAMSIGFLGKSPSIAAETSLLLQRANLIVVEGGDSDE